MPVLGISGAISSIYERRSPQNINGSTRHPCYPRYFCCRSALTPGNGSKSGNSSSTVRCRNTLVHGHSRSISNIGFVATHRRGPSSSLLARPRSARMTASAVRRALAPYALARSAPPASTRARCRSARISSPCHRASSPVRLQERRPGGAGRPHRPFRSCPRHPSRRLGDID